MKIGYARVSTQDQNLLLQLDAMKNTGCEKIYQEKANGAKADRPELTKLLEHVLEGDTVVIWKLDRLSRLLTHLVKLVTQLESKSIRLISLNDSVDTTTAKGRLVFRIFASLDEFERELIKERTAPGLDSAWRRGQHLGRKTGLSKTAVDNTRIAESLYKANSWCSRSPISWVSPRIRCINISRNERLTRLT